MNTSQTPKIGMLCTIKYWSDSEPAEVVDIKDRSILVRRMDAKLIKGSAQDGSAEWEYISNPKRPLEEFTLRKNGRYYPKGCGIKQSNPLSLGFARKYIDPSF